MVGGRSAAQDWLGEVARPNSRHVVETSANSVVVWLVPGLCIWFQSCSIDAILLDHHKFGERKSHADIGLILVTGAAGQLGAGGRTVTELLLDRGLPVRAMVRREDERAAALRAAGAEVVIGDVLEPADVYRVVRGCPRVYFGMSVSAGYLTATVTMAAVARESGWTPWSTCPR
jgi:NAD(P)H-binding